MKPKIAVASLCVLTAIAVVGLRIAARHSQSGIAAQQVRTFQVNGQIRSIDLPAGTVRIAHEAIPDYMPAMTMSLPVKDAALLKNLAPEQRVAFQLTVTADDSWISRIDRIEPESAPGAITASPAESRQEREAGRVQTGQPVPDFALTDQNGHPIHLSDFRGKAVILTFIYTRCPLPNYCPLMSKNFQSLQERLNKAFPGRYQLLSISIDPQFDRPAVLKEYAARYAADEKLWAFATGADDEIDLVANMFGLFHQPENGLIAHDLRTALIGPDGRLVHMWKSNVWTPYEVQRMVVELFGRAS